VRNVKKSGKEKANGVNLCRGAIKGVGDIFQLLAGSPANDGNIWFWHGNRCTEKPFPFLYLYFFNKFLAVGETG
jgi:hypothetical protein